MKKITYWLKKHWIFVTAIILIVALAITVWYFIHNFEASVKSGELRPDYYPFHHIENHGDNGNMPPVQQPLTIGEIEPWMTFDYVNFAFKLPKDYFKNILGINDPRYPNLRIDGYAREAHIDQTLLMTVVKRYVTVYTAH